MATARIRWRAAGWKALLAAPGIRSDVEDRALAIGVQAEATASPTATIRVEAGVTRSGRRPRAAVIAGDVKPRRDATYRALLAALDAGR